MDADRKKLMYSEVVVKTDLIVLLEVGFSTCLCPCTCFGGVSHDLTFLPQCPGGVQMLEGQQIAGDHLQCYDRL